MQAQDCPRGRWEDLLLVEEHLGEEERALQFALRKFAAAELAPRVRALYASESTPRELFLQFGEMGLLGATIQGWGCAGMNNVCAGLIGYELERVDSGFHTMVSAQSNLAMHAIHRFGSDAQKNCYLPRLARGELVGCFGLTEPDHGSDPSRMASVARVRDGGHVLSGRKSWISNAPIADVFVIWVKAGTPGMIRGFVLERGMPGLSTTTISGKLGLRASTTGDVVMDEVFVPAANVLGEVAGMRGPLACINKARYGLCWGALGAATACWHQARDYVMQRRQFGRPLAANQLVQKKLADMQTEIVLGLAAALHAGRLLDQGRLSAEAVALLKRNACGKALEIARTARDMLGGNGMSDAYAVMRHMCNLEALNTYEGTSDVNALILGHAQTGISAFSV